MQGDQLCIDTLSEAEYLLKVNVGLRVNYAAVSTKGHQGKGVNCEAEGPSKNLFLLSSHSWILCLSHQLPTPRPVR